MAVSTERYQVVGRRGVRRRVLVGPVVHFDSGLLAAPLADAARAGEGLVPGAPVDGVVAAVEPGRVRWRSVWHRGVTPRMLGASGRR